MATENTENKDKNNSTETPKKKKLTAVFRPNNAGGPAGRRGGSGGRAAGAGRSGYDRGSRDQGRPAQTSRTVTMKSADQLRDRASEHNAEKQDELYAEAIRNRKAEEAAAEEAAKAAKAAEEAKAAAEAKAAEEKAAEEAKAAEAAAAKKAEEAAAQKAETAAKEAQPEPAAEIPAPADTAAEKPAEAPEKAPAVKAEAAEEAQKPAARRPAPTRRPSSGTGTERKGAYSSDARRPSGNVSRSSGEQGGRASSDRRGGMGRPAGSRSGGAAAGGFRRPSGGGALAGAVGSGQGRGGAPARRGRNDHRSDRKGRNDESREDLIGLNKGRNRKGAFQRPEPVVQEEKIKTITLPDTITIKELADKMKVPAAQIIKKLFLAGQVLTVNQEIDYETAENIAVDYDILCEHEEKIDVIAELLKDTEDPEETLKARPPVVCVMGHVDHGKTSLLDAIRNTNVISREAGGITQHIGAYMVNINGHDITFLDTPGHEAFTAMRMRGAKSTDIAVLVVAADDGVMPQTVEAIHHAQAAEVEIIVAINKIDKPSANVDRVKQELTEYELIPEEWGGSTIFCPVSAKTGEGLENLLEMILLTADIKELRANPDRSARGLVLEARLDRGRGPVASVLVQKGTLHVGDYIAAGACSGKVRGMIDDKGTRVKVAGPSVPVEVIGLNDVPGAGEICVSLPTDKEAKNYAAAFIAEGREKLLEETRTNTKMSLDDLFNRIQEGRLKELNLIVKADVQGSVEALKSSLEKLSNDEVVVKIIHSGVGAINESDVVLASASSAIIIGFNVRPDNAAKSTADTEHVDIRLYNVIYQAIDDVDSAMKGMLEPIYQEQVIGHGEVRQTFKASGVGTIAGSYVTDGKVEFTASARVTRKGDLVFEGKIGSLKRFKDDVKEVSKGYECGLVFEGFPDVQEGDEFEVYKMVEVPRT